MSEKQRSSRPGLFAVVGLLALSVGLGGCAKTREAFGLGKSTPDEFAVVTRAPLSLPPDYGLRPPTPGIRRPQESEIKEEARRILVSSGSGGAITESSAAPSVGESALLSRAGADNVDPSIRQQVSRESQVLAAGDKTFVDRLIFWRKPKPKFSEIDAAREARRLSENSALGDPATKGPTPVIKRKKKGLFGDLF
jgi:Protein of unknown function (DUF3035)